MKYNYTLMPVINGKTVPVNKKFSTRNKAIDAFFRMIAVRGLDIQVEEIIERGNKHNLEYICNRDSRFFISRTLAA